MPGLRSAGVVTTAKKRRRATDANVKGKSPKKSPKKRLKF